MSVLCIPRLIVVGLGFIALSGCGSSTPICDTSDIDNGGLTGTINDESWSTSGVTYLWSGQSLMINAPYTGDYWMSAVIQSDNAGAPLDQILTPNIPVTVTLDTAGSTGWATVYPDTGASYSTKSGGGEFTVTLHDDGTLSGCFSVDAGSDNNTLSINAAFIAQPTAL